MLPQYEQARKSVWNAVNPHSGKKRIDEAFPLEIRKRTDQQQMLIEFVNGSTWQLVGSDNFNSLVGSPPIGVTASEWALADPSAWAYIRPILRENGGWFVAITTPRGNNHVKTMVDSHKDNPNWFVQVLSVNETKTLTQEQLDEELKEYQDEYGPEDGRLLFEQEYMCSFDAALVGSYYGSMMAVAREDNRIKRVPYEPGHLVHTGWDLGRKDTNPVWMFQVIGGEVRVIDYISNSGVPPDWYVSEMNKKGYQWGTDFCPHDIEVTDYSELMGNSRKQILQKLKRNVHVVPQTRLYDQVAAVRQVLPTAVFDDERTEAGRNGLANYRREWDDKRKTFHDIPVHDWASHPASAFFCVAYGVTRLSLHSEAQKPKPIPYRRRLSA